MTDNHQDQRPRQETETETNSGTFIYDEFAGRHGTTASKSALNDEKQVVNLAAVRAWSRSATSWRSRANPWCGHNATCSRRNDVRLPRNRRGRA